MKALSFLEFFGLTPQEKRDYLDRIELISKNDYKDRWSCDDSELFFSDVYYKEVSIEFKPEQITELFEGIEKADSTRYWTANYEVSFAKAQLGLYTLYNTDDRIERILFLPRTLDDFIRDCVRAGIEIIRRKK